MIGRRLAAAGFGHAAAVAAGLLLSTLLAGQAASQQDGGTRDPPKTAPGMVTTQNFDGPADGFSVAVAPYDDTELNLKLKGDFERLLTERRQVQVTAEAKAAFLLLFEADVVPADLAPPPPSLGSARVSGAGAEVQVNVWSSSQDSVLGGRQEAAEGGSNVFHVNALLRDRASGAVVWQGDAYYVLREPDPERVARALVPPLVDRIGQSVVREPLEIDR